MNINASNNNLYLLISEAGTTSSSALPLISLTVLSKLLEGHLDCKARLDLTTLRGSDLDGCLACPNRPPGPEPAVGWQSWDGNSDWVVN